MRATILRLVAAMLALSSSACHGGAGSGQNLVPTAMTASSTLSRTTAAPTRLWFSSCTTCEIAMIPNKEVDLLDSHRVFAIAESAHIASQLDALAMQTALSTAAGAAIKGLLFVNCSPAHMHDPYKRVAEAAAYCRGLNIDPANVVLEVVETERHEREHLRAFTLACRKHGFLVALDDLGSGYSSLTVLSELRPDILKFDRDLVRSIDRDPYRALIVNRLLECARVLALSTVVEGIETQAELAWAAANGATYVQGNFIGKPALPRD